MTDCEALIFDESELLVLVKKGDDAAFAQLIDRFMPMLRQETARVRVNAADDDDYIQEASLGLLSAARAYREDQGASFSTFARVCVRRRLLNALQAVPNVDLPSEDTALFDEIDNDLFAARLDPDEWLLHKEDEAALLDRLRALLSSMEYHVLVLHMASYSYDEIAQALAITPKSVDNAIQRIRRKLMRAL